MLPMLRADFNPITYGYWRPILRRLDDMLDTATLFDPEQWERANAEWMPRFQVEEDADHYLVTGDLPGVAREDLNIELHGSRLVIEGERKSEGKSGTRRYGKLNKP